MPLFVNGEPIEDAQLREEERTLRPAMAEAIPFDDPVTFESQVREWARDNLIERILLRQAALADPEPLPERLPEPQEEESVQEQTQRRMERLLVRVTARVKTPKAQEAADHYRKHREEFLLPEALHATHIVKNVDDNCSETDAQKAIEAALVLLGQGTPFEEVADQHSDCPGRGGDLGFFARGQMVDEFDAVVFSLPIGELSPIFRTSFGFHIAKVVERREAGYRPLSEVRPQIEEMLKEQAKRSLIENYLDALRAKADIQGI